MGNHNKDKYVKKDTQKKANKAAADSKQALAVAKSAKKTAQHADQVAHKADHKASHTQKAGALTKAMRHWQQRPAYTTAFELARNIWLASLFNSTRTKSRGRAAGTFQATAMGSYRGSTTVSLTTGNTCAAIVINPYASLTDSTLVQFTQATSLTTLAGNTGQVYSSAGPNLAGFAIAMRITAFEAVLTVESNSYVTQGDINGIVMMKGALMDRADLQGMMNSPFAYSMPCIPGAKMVTHQFPQTPDQDVFTNLGNWSGIRYLITNSAAGNTFRLDWFMHIEYLPTLNLRPLVNLDMSRVPPDASSHLANLVQKKPQLVISSAGEFSRAANMFKGIPNTGVSFGIMGVGGAFSAQQADHAMPIKNNQPDQEEIDFEEQYKGGMTVIEEQHIENEKKNNFRVVHQKIKEFAEKVACSCGLPGCPEPKVSITHLPHGHNHGGGQHSITYDNSL